MIRLRFLRAAVAACFLSVLGASAWQPMTGAALGDAPGIDSSQPASRLGQEELPASASYPFYDDFESGSLGDGWTVETTNQGRVRAYTGYPHQGSYSLQLDDSVSDSTYSYARAILTVDLAGQSGVLLDFWWDEFVYDSSSEGVYISDDFGATWYRVLSFYENDPTGWRHQIIDLDAAIALAGMSFNDHFQVRFQFSNDDPIPSDGYSIDQVQVRPKPLPVAASFPFSDGFESGELSDHWLVDFTNEGRVRVGTGYAHDGEYSLLLDDWEADSIYSYARATLTVDLAGQSGVLLDFWWDEFVYDSSSEGVYISDDFGASWHQVVSFYTNDPTGWRHEVIDLDAAIALAGMSFNDHFQVRFQFSNDDPIPSDGYSIDQVQVRPNADPELNWAGTTNYVQDGLHPESGDIRDTFTYRIQYSDVDGDAPSYVRTHILKGGAEISGSPFEMLCQEGDYETGVLCDYAKETLESGGDYTYFFSAQDEHGSNVASTPELHAPLVTISYRAHIPTLLVDMGPPTAPPVLAAIDNPENDYRFEVSWSAVERAAEYILEEAQEASFGTPEIAYRGSHTATNVRVDEVGSYYYRVRAANTYGSSGWSNVQSVDVTSAPPACPNAGTWRGTTDEGDPVVFTVSEGPGCEVESFTISARLYCFITGNMLFYTGTYENLEIEAGLFSFNVSYWDTYCDTTCTERFDGEFLTESTAAGEFYFKACDTTTIPITGRYCIAIDDWSAVHQP